MAKNNADKVRFKEMAALDKENKLPLNYTFSYVIVPAYIVLSAILLTVFAVMMHGERLVPCVVILGVLALLLAALIALYFYVHKRAIASELERYDIENCLKKVDEMESREEWNFSDGELNVRCKKYGMETDGVLSYYNHLRKAVITSNEFSRVNILICFVNASDHVIAMPLNAKTLKMLRDFDVKLDNQPVLDHILAHPKEAFTEIYKTGEVKLTDRTAN